MTKHKGLMQSALMLASLALAGAVAAQSWGPRTLDELKQETLRRAEAGAGPIGNVDMNDARRAMTALKDLEPDTWAKVWDDIGDEYLARAAKASSPAEAREDYHSAWHYYDVGRWPTEKNSPGKRRSYEKGLEAFQQYAKLVDPPIETVHIPYENTELVAYLRIPEGVTHPPVVFSMNGLDSRKEGVIAGSDRYIAAGVAVFAIDMPGTGQSPVLIDVGSEKTLSRAIDYLQTRTDVDGSRIVVQGRSWSGYWAAVLAYVERDRILGAAVHGCGCDRYFSREWQEAQLKTKEYLFDLFPARSAVYGVKTLEDFYAYGPRLSLVARGFIDQPSAPMLLVNGEKDSQQPISDMYLLMKHGDPKLTWINPDGGHMGRSKQWPSRRIMAEVVEPWVLQRLGVTSGQVDAGPLDLRSAK